MPNPAALQSARPGVDANASPSEALDIREWVVDCADDGADLNQASFRGVPFYVASDDTETGRRIASHEFPNRDEPFQEDLGQKAVVFKVKGYIFGGAVEHWKDTLLTACASGGSADLILPYMDAVQAVCKSVVAARSVEKLGWFDFTFEFHAIDKLGLEAYDPPNEGYDDQQLGVVYEMTLLGTIRFYYNWWMSLDWSITGVLTLLGVDAGLISVCQALVYDRANVSLARELGALVNVPLAGLLHDGQAVERFLTDTAIGRIQDFGFAVMGLAATLASPLPPENDPTAPPTYLPVALLSGGVNPPSDLSQLVRDAGGLVNDAPLYVARDPGTGRVRTDHWTVIGQVIDRIPMVFEPAQAVLALKALCAFSSHPPLPSPSQAAVMQTPPAFVMRASSDVIDANNEFVFGGGIRRLALVQLARTFVTYPFATRGEAVAARAYLAEAFGQEIGNVGNGVGASDQGVGAALTLARDLAIRSITDRMVTLAGTLDVTAPASMSALYYAARLYGDAERADELAERNGVFDPLFMPLTFVALTK